ncbi:hypothetical protein Taro_028425 [Colocasia esculenta]|uniref:DUF7866 domain-containing protein n=1 Tax=Colocasia esculenta TaxID=4460 RepID=A0A843VGH1_COLES|nr:hypothetical protein [Colocasia esculenta]
MSSGIGAISHFLLFILVFLVASASRGASSGLQQQLPVQQLAEGGVANETWVMKPLEAPGLGRLVLNETRRRLGSFQICALCTCCGGPRGLCLLSPCCYAINCNIPNRPFGFCSFTPKSCSCFGCYL